MTISEWLAEARTRIDALDAELIAVRAFAPGDSAMNGAEVDRSWLAAHGEDETSEDLATLANEMVARRASGEPLAYIFGFKEFYGRQFKVSSEVLIPRPETEGLIELVRGLDLSEKPKFLEIGTGSGCIAVTLAAEFPRAKVVATDVSTEALEIARENNVVLGAGVEFYRGDLLEDLSDDAGGFDVLVSNLPYVDEGWEWLDERTLDFEPKLALYAEDGGLALYKKLILQMKARGEGFVKYIVFEADPCQHEALIQFAGEQGFSLVKEEGFGVVFRGI